MTLREEVILILRGRGKTEEEIDAHMKKVEQFFEDLARFAPIPIVAATMTSVPTEHAIDFDDRERDA